MKNLITLWMLSLYLLLSSCTTHPYYRQSSSNNNEVNTITFSPYWNTKTEFKRLNGAYYAELC